MAINFKPLCLIAFVSLFFITGCPEQPAGNGTNNTDISTNFYWADEFNGDSIDTVNNWVFETGTGSGGWGNNEAEYYTSRTNNAYLMDDGTGTNKYLVIKALSESMGGKSYTSARMKTYGKRSFLYSNGKTLRIEARMKLPSGLTNGSWPAFWMLGTNINTASWPGCGEIDIMEAGLKPLTVYQPNGAFHWGGDYGKSITLSTPLSSGFHIYSLEWNASMMTIAVDNQTIISMATTTSVIFQKPYFIILNLALGGNWAYAVDSSIMPQYMYVDWLRVYEK